MTHQPLAKAEQFRLQKQAVLKCGRPTPCKKQGFPNPTLCQSQTPWPTLTRTKVVPNASSQPHTRSIERNRVDIPSSYRSRTASSMLWEKGASLLLIRELLSTVNVSVSPLTISKFLADIGVPSRQRRTAKATKRTPQSKTKTIIQQSPLEPPVTEAAESSDIRRQSNTELQGSTPADVRTSNTLQPEPIPPLARQRIRGPRIANPATI